MECVCPAQSRLSVVLRSQVHAAVCGFLWVGRFEPRAFCASSTLLSRAQPPALTSLLSEIILDWERPVNITEEAEEKRSPKIAWAGKDEQFRGVGCGLSEQNV